MSRKDYATRFNIVTMNFYGRPYIFAFVFQQFLHRLKSFIWLSRAQCFFLRRCSNVSLTHKSFPAIVVVHSISRVQVGSSSWITQLNFQNVSPIILLIVAYLKFDMLFSSFWHFCHCVIPQGRRSTILCFSIWKGRGHTKKKIVGDDQTGGRGSKILGRSNTFSLIWANLLKIKRKKCLQVVQLISKPQITYRSTYSISIIWPTGNLC